MRNRLESEIGLSQYKMRLSFEMSNVPMVCVVLQTAWMRQVIMQVNMQAAVVRTHREGQALVAQTPTLHGERTCAEVRLHRFDRPTGSGILTEG
jgi:hypothetical protein